MENEIKTIRGELDGLAEAIFNLKPITIGDKDIEITIPSWNSKEIMLAQKKVLYAKAWLGKVLEGLGTPSPYTNDGKRTDVASIEPTADVGYFVFPKKDLRELNHIEKVDWLREQIKTYIDRVEKIRDNVELTRFLSIAFTNVYNYLCEARFELGFELERIRKENKTVYDVIKDQVEEELEKTRNKYAQ